MSEYKVINASQISREKWWGFTDNNENCNIFTTPYMYDVWNATPGYKSFAFFAIDENQEIHGILTGHLETVSKGLLSKLSTRAVLMQAPVAIEDEALSDLLTHYLNFKKGRAVYTEIRNNYDTLNQRYIYKNLGFKFEDHLNIIIDLRLSEDELWRNINTTKRKSIRKAIKSGIIVKELDISEFSEAYNILEEVYRRIKLPLIPYNFLEFAYKNNTSFCKINVCGAFLNNCIIGAKLLLKYKDKVISLYSGSREDFYSYKTNDVLNWEVFLLCKKEGYDSFDFGGAGKPDVPYGVRDYKIQFGGNLVNYGRYNLVHNPINMKLAETGFKIYQKVRL